MRHTAVSAPWAEEPKAYFDDKRNITVGCGRVIYAQVAHPVERERVGEGWVLPGGRRTQDREEAKAAAAYLGLYSKPLPTLKGK